MKFISWNVNGLKNCIEKGDFQKTFEEIDADFFCIQEVKNKEQINFEHEDYMQFWNFAKIKSGYSGTAIFCKKKPNKVYYGIQNEYGEELDNEGRIITLEYSDFYLVNCYVPNSKLNKERLNYRLRFDEIFKEYIKKLNNQKNVIICGDFNISYKNIDIYTEYRNIKNASNMNNVIRFYDEERISFEELLNMGLIDTFRYFHPQEQKFSWWFDNDSRKSNIGWRLDYFLISEELRKNIRKADIHNNIYGSDHCPIELVLEV